MSYNQHKQRAVDPGEPIAHCMSHLRSCARHIADQYHIHRDLVFKAVEARTGLDLTSLLSDEDIRRAVDDLESLRANRRPPDAGHTGRTPA